MARPNITTTSTAEFTANDMQNVPRSQLEELATWLDKNVCKLRSDAGYVAPIVASEALQVSIQKIVNRDLHNTLIAYQVFLMLQPSDAARTTDQVVPEDQQKTATVNILSHILSTKIDPHLVRMGCRIVTLEFDVHGKLQNSSFNENIADKIEVFKRLIDHYRANKLIEPPVVGLAISVVGHMGLSSKQLTPASQQASQEDGELLKSFNLRRQIIGILSNLTSDNIVQNRRALEGLLVNGFAPSIGAQRMDERGRYPSLFNRFQFTRNERNEEVIYRSNKNQNVLNCAEWLMENIDSILQGKNKSIVIENLSLDQEETKLEEKMKQQESLTMALARSSRRRDMSKGGTKLPLESYAERRTLTSTADVARLSSPVFSASSTAASGQVASSLHFGRGPGVVPAGGQAGLGGRFEDQDSLLGEFRRYSVSAEPPFSAMPRSRDVGDNVSWGQPLPLPQAQQSSDRRTGMPAQYSEPGNPGQFSSMSNMSLSSTKSNDGRFPGIGRSLRDPVFERPTVDLDAALAQQESPIPPSDPLVGPGAATTLDRGRNRLGSKGE